MSDLRRLVVVTSGFGVWELGRHLVSARWADVRRVRARRPAPGAAPGAPAVIVSLADGAEIAFDAGLRGLAAFLAAAPVALLGTGAPSADWQQTLAGAPSDRDEVVLFERRADAAWRPER